VVAVDRSDQEVKHLEMIQAVIARMASSSASLKTWTVTLLAGIFALSAKDADRRFLIVALAPALGFWALDAYYLTQERRYRRLYDAVRLQEQVDPFSMATFQYASALPYAAALVSTTLLMFYGAITVFVLVLTWVIF
jgi:hypothetical protein